MIFRRRRVLAAGLLAACDRACPGPQSKTGRPGCTKDTDCRAPRVCVESACTDPRPIAASVAADASPRASAPPAGRPGAPPFAMFGGDARHTGRRGGPAPAQAPERSCGAPTSTAWSPGRRRSGPTGASTSRRTTARSTRSSRAARSTWSFKTGDRSVVDAGDREGRHDLHRLGRRSPVRDHERRQAQVEAAARRLRSERLRPGVDRGATSTAARPSVPTARSTSAATASTRCGPTARCAGSSRRPSTCASTPALAPDGTVYAGCSGRRALRDRARRHGQVAGPHRRRRRQLACDRRTTARSTSAATITISTRSRPRARSCGRSSPAPTSAAVRRSAPTARSTSAASMRRCTPSRRTGQVRWKLAAADKIEGTPGIATDGTILVGAQDEHVYAVAPDGTLRWWIQLRRRRRYHARDRAPTAPCTSPATTGTFTLSNSKKRKSCLRSIDRPSSSACLAWSPRASSSLRSPTSSACASTNTPSSAPRCSISSRTARSSC